MYLRYPPLHRSSCHYPMSHPSGYGAIPIQGEDHTLGSETMERASKRMDHGEEAGGSMGNKVVARLYEALAEDRRRLREFDRPPEQGRNTATWLIAEVVEKH